MITYLAVYPLLVAACPGYEESSYAACAGEENGEFLRVGQLVLHLIDFLERDQTEHLRAVFGVVEWVLAEGDEEARSLITDGFFDDLADPQFYAKDTKQPADFMPWLGPHASALPAVRRLAEPPPG